MISHPRRDLALINTAGFLRSFGTGLMGVVLGIYLFRSGLSSTAIGLIIAMGLAGAASATVLMTIAADRFGRKWFLSFLLSVLSAVGGIALVLSPSVPCLASWHSWECSMAQARIVRQRLRLTTRSCPGWFPT